MGSSDIPMNVGSEVFDYVLVTDARENGSTRTGNLGHLSRHYNADRGEWRTTFIFGDWMTVNKALSGLGVSADDIQNSTSRMKIKNLYVENIQADNLNFEEFDLDDLPDGTSYQRAKSTSLDADGIVILDQVYIDSVGGTYDLVARADISAHHIKLSSVEQSASYRTSTDGEKATWDGKPDDMDDLGDGATYKKVLAADISAGHINLTTNFLINGVSQATAGVSIDSTDGITIDGGKLKFISPNEIHSHVMSLDNNGYMRIGVIGDQFFNLCSPDVTNTRYLGSDGRTWLSGCVGTWTIKTQLNVVDIVMSGQAKTFRIENRTSDPGTPSVGQMWLRTDL